MVVVPADVGIDPEGRDQAAARLQTHAEESGRLTSIALSCLSLDNVLPVYEGPIANEGCIGLVSDRGLLEPAVGMPRAMFSGEHLHKGLAAMATATLCHLCQNHPFNDEGRPDRLVLQPGADGWLRSDRRLDDSSGVWEFPSGPQAVQPPAGGL